MKVIVDGRRSGKTTRLIQFCAAKGGYIVTRDHKAACLIADQAEELGLHILFPLTYHEFLTNGYHARGVSKVHIDDVEELLVNISKVPVASISITSDDSSGQTKTLDNEPLVG